jgi:uncharacterized protein with WD repeat
MKKTLFQRKATWVFSPVMVIISILAYYQLLYKPKQVNSGIAVLQKTFKLHHADVWVNRFLKGTNLLASCGVDSTVKLFDYQTGKVIRIFRHPLGVTYFDFSPNGEYLATSSYDQIVRLFRVADGVLIREFKGHTNTPWSVCFSPDGKTLASSGEDASIKMWEVSSGKPIRTINGHARTVWDVKFSPDGKTLVSGSFDTKVKIWNVADGKLIKTLDGHTQAVAAIAFNKQGDLLATASDDKTIKLWDYKNGNLIRVLNVPEHAQGLAFSLDGTRLATSGRDKIMIGEFLQNFFGDSHFNKGVSVRLWDVSTGKLLQTFSEQSNDVNDVDFSDDGKYLSGASSDGTVCLWKMVK